VATATNNLTAKLDAASQAAEQFAQAGKTVVEKSSELGNTYTQVSEDMQKVVAGTKAYENQIVAVGAQLQKLNAVYELQLNALQSQVDAYKAQTEKVAGVTTQVETLVANVQTMNTVAAEALKSQEAYAAGAKQLANQVADLNKVYGNMLNAL
jgi:chromosome segregation ATPase